MHRKHVKKTAKKKGMDGSWYNSPTTTLSSNTDSLPYKIAYLGAGLLIVYGIVWVASKAWTKGEQA